MATDSSTLAWKIPWTEKPGGLQSMGSRRVGHNWATSLSLFIFMHWRRKWQPTPVFLPGESQGRGAWWAAVYGVAQSRTRLSSSSSSSSRVRKVKLCDQNWSLFTKSMLPFCPDIPVDYIPISFSVILTLEVAQSCLTLCNPMDRSLPRSSIHGIFQARVLCYQK